MKKLISKLKEVPDLESKHPWSPVSLSYNSSVNNENINTAPNHSHLHGFIGKKFTIGRQIVVVDDIVAEGGFGLVFKVRTQNDQVFALKRLCVNNRSDLKVCKREITIMSSLTHKNILSLIDSQINEQSSGIYEVLMLLSYCPKNVAQLMQSKQKMQQHLSENVITKILCDIIEAVARLHYCQTPVIHRDLKVENILIDERNNYVLCDFGSATAKQIIPTEYGITKTEEEISKYTTLAYRSPEMVQLGNDIINCKADIWALGCLLYYLCFFTLPFADKILAIQSGKFTIPKIDVVYSDKILKLIQYMLTPNPAERPSIYQISVLAFSLTNRKTPIQNLDKERVPNWNDLQLPNTTQSPKKTVSDGKHQQSAPIDSLNNNILKASSNNTSATRSRSVVTQNRSHETSINPRNRPRANKLAIGKSDSHDTFPDHLAEKSPSINHNMSQSNSFNFSLSNSKSNLPKSPIEKSDNSSSVQQEVLNPSNPPHIVSNEVSNPHVESTPKCQLNVERSDIQKLRLGHRRMVSECSSKPVVEENLKSGKSLLELGRKEYSGSGDDNLAVDSTVGMTKDPQVASVQLNDDEDNDALFGEEFDKIRHQSD